MPRNRIVFFSFEKEAATFRQTFLASMEFVVPTEAL